MSDTCHLFRSELTGSDRFYSDSELDTNVQVDSEQNQVVLIRMAGWGMWEELTDTRNTATCHVSGF